METADGHSPASKGVRLEELQTSLAAPRIHTGTDKGTGEQLHHRTYAFSDRIGDFVPRSIPENRLIPQAARRFLRRIGSVSYTHLTLPTSDLV